MDRILTLPLRSALHLPRCTSRSALFAEYGLANMQLTREYQQLAYANRLLNHSPHLRLLNSIQLRPLLEASYTRTGNIRPTVLETILATAISTPISLACESTYHQWIGTEDNR